MVVNIIRGHQLALKALCQLVQPGDALDVIAAIVMAGGKIKIASKCRAIIFYIGLKGFIDLFGANGDQLQAFCAVINVRAVKFAITFFRASRSVRPNKL